MNKSRILILLALGCLLSLLTVPALAQTPEPTPAVTPNATPAPTPEAKGTPEAPVVEVTIEAPVAIEPVVVPVSAFEKIVDLLIAIVLAGGGVAAIKVFRDPERGKQFVTFGIDLLKMAAKFTPTPADDAALLRLEDAWKTALAGMVAQSVRDVIAEERVKLREDANAQAANRTINFVVPPPPNSVDPDQG